MKWGKKSKWNEWLELMLGLAIAIVLVLAAALGLRYGLATYAPGSKFQQGNPSPFSYFYDELRSRVRAEALAGASKRLGITIEELAEVVGDASYTSLVRESSSVNRVVQRIETLKDVRSYFNSLEDKLLEAHINALAHEQSANNEVNDAPSDWLVELNELENTLFHGKESLRKRLEGILKSLAKITQKGYLMNKQPTMIDDPNKCKMMIIGFRGPLSLGVASTRMPETPPAGNFNSEFEDEFGFSAMYEYVTAELAAQIKEQDITSSRPGNRFSSVYPTEKQLRISDEGKSVSEIDMAAKEERRIILEILARARYQIQKEAEVLIIKKTKERLELELENFLGSMKRIEELAEQMEEVSRQKLQTIPQC